MKANIKNYTIEELEEYFVGIGEKPYRATQIFEWLYKEKIDSFDDMNNISIDLRNSLKENFEITKFNILKRQESKDGTVKYLFDILDSNAIETVLMDYHHGMTVCVSTQVGCKMACDFCESGKKGFVRDLTSAEIIEQIQTVEKLEGVRVSNIVFMGIGEPFDNYLNVMKAIEILNHHKGLNIGARHITLSTSGIVPKIYELALAKIPVRLSISLHSAKEDVRTSLMPINKTYNIKEVIKAAKYYVEKTNKRISFEYALIRDINDSLEDAKALQKLLKGMLCHVNLIPMNEASGSKYLKSKDKNIIEFRDYLNENNIVATIRRELGSDIDAACGQLRKKEVEKK